MNKTDLSLEEKFEQVLDYKIEKLKNNEKRKLYIHLKDYYHASKKVSYQAITKILFGDSLFLRPQYPPMIGPGIVSDQKSLQFVVPKKRVSEIRKESALLQSKFMLRFLTNGSDHKEEDECTNDKVNFFLNFTINDQKFHRPINKPFTIDLKLFNRENNLIHFDFNQKNCQVVIAFQHLCKIELKTIVNAIVQRKTLPEEQTKKLLQKFLINSFQNKSFKKKQSNLIKIQKRFQIVSVKCPLSNTMIKIPARSNNCIHLQSFDLGNFLFNAEKTKNWCCPICKKQAKLECLIIDGYLKKIYETKGLNIESKIQIFNDGKYKLFTPTITSKRISRRQSLDYCDQNQLNFQNLKINDIKTNDEKNVRKRNILKIYGSKKEDLSKNNILQIQQQNKKKKFSRVYNHDQRKIESTIMALRTFSNWKSFQPKKITIKK
ncbi:zinc finger miz domain-containing protein [Anaeramoeba flamelloides]|uniref:Zinc finger miz domain-containing protein n=1 Tax=Anaeramoeba flamelloides TaxID=1746091 RepID=A0ABQ8XMN0_9EUKA|nr:zinc finger miz domain-containing protein [Anaeramoeba flamelloides]